MSDVQLLPTDKLAWHEERIRIPLPPADVYARLSNAPLEDLLPGTDTFPAVVATEPVNDIPFRIREHVGASSLPTAAAPWKR
jgi:hypothetical protein